MNNKIDGNPRYIISYVGNEGSANYGQPYANPNQNANFSNNVMQSQVNGAYNNVEVQDMKHYIAIFNPEVIGIFDSYIKLCAYLTRDEKLKFLINKYSVLDTVVVNTIEEGIRYLNKSMITYYAPRLNWEVIRLKVPNLSNLSCNIPMFLGDNMPSQDMINGQSYIPLKE